MVINTLCPAVHILVSQNVYGRAEGIADHYWPWAVFWWMYLQTDKWMYRTSFISGTCFFVPGIIPQPPAILQTHLQSQRGLRNARWHLRNSARHKETGPRMRLCPIPAFVRPYVHSSEGIEGAYSSSEGLWWSTAAEKFVEMLVRNHHTVTEALNSQWFLLPH